VALSRLIYQRLPRSHGLEHQIDVTNYAGVMCLSVTPAKLPPVRKRRAAMLLCVEGSEGFGRIIMDSRHSTPRDIVQRLTFIVLSDKTPKIKCTARNISDVGATLGLSPTFNLPRRFDVVIDGHRRQCRMIWRTDREVRISFD